MQIFVYSLLSVYKFINSIAHRSFTPLFSPPRMKRGCWIQEKYQNNNFDGEGDREELHTLFRGGNE